MRTGVAIGTGIGGLFLAVVVGIATLPDEVLLESQPNFEESSQFVQPITESKSNVMDVEPVPTEVVLPLIEEIPSTPTKEEPTPQVQEETQPTEKEKQPENIESTPSNPPKESEKSPENTDQKNDEKTKTNVIKINLKDGVGSKDR